MTLSAFSGEPSATRLVPRQSWRGTIRDHGERTVAEETAVALTYDRSCHAVMMATPQDLEDFGVGFSLTDGIVDAAAEIDDIEIVASDDGVEVRMSLANGPRRAFNARRRHLAGPTGCGLCGIESLAEAMRPPRRVSTAHSVLASTIAAAIAAMPSRQALNRQTRAAHAAAFWREGDGLITLREDVGRHNALDKVIGALARQGTEAANGIVLVTSRVSVELVQKTAVLGAPILVAISAPTALAIRACQQAGITLAAIARGDGFEVFTHGERVKAG